jgi:hypothetical protein
MSDTDKRVRRSNETPIRRGQMNTQGQIDKYISDQSVSKREDMQLLHRMVLRAAPESKLWFLDGRDSENKIVSNPNIGYGSKTRKYASGETREFYQVGLSANTTGISVYIMGIEDKNYLSETYGERLGKAKITGYCVKFRNLKDIDTDVLEEMIANHMGVG